MYGRCYFIGADKYADRSVSARNVLLFHAHYLLYFNAKCGGEPDYTALSLGYDEHLQQLIRRLKLRYLKCGASYAWSAALKSLQFL